MEKYLYFATAAADATAATEEVIMVGASDISHFEMDTATRLNIHLKKDVAQEVLGGDGDDQNLIGLDITSGKHKEVMQDIAESINRLSGSFGFINIADSEKSVFCSEHITACATISVVDAS
tara:strand:- start:282 stop:644 length:363 start_codon:yes stop_codon:yes gene_type:complete